MPGRDVMDKYCPLAGAYLIKRDPPKLPLYCTNPLATEITHLFVLDIAEARAAVDKVFRQWAAFGYATFPWAEST